MSNTNHPFSDPSIQAVVENSQGIQADDDYNPFSNITVPGSNVSYTSSHRPTLPQTTISPSKPDQLRQHIEILEESRAHIDRMDLTGSMQEQSSSHFDREHNFPPLPRFCPLKPCFYQDIQREIPVAFQKWTTYTFYLWLGMVAILLTNVIVAFVCMLADISKVINLIVAIVWFCAIIPLSYLMWFRPIYKAFRNNSSMNFMIFFFVFFLHIIFSFMMIIGAFPSGFCGLLLVFEMIRQPGILYKLAGILCVIVTVLLIFETGFSIMILIQIHKLYRTTGASLSRAQQEFSTNVISNRQARNAAMNIAASTYSS